MNQPAAKRFSLQRLLTSPAPSPLTAAPADVPALPPEPALPESGAPERTPLASSAPSAPPAESVPAFRDLGVPSRRLEGTPRPEPESHPKKKRSYSVDMKLCEDLEVLSWYQGRSSSSVVEELVRKHLQHQRILVAKAKEIRNSR